MQYDFYISTTQGIKNSTVNSIYDFSAAPFGFVSYRNICTCECEQLLIDDFWRCVDDVLLANNLSSDDFIRAIRAYSNDKLYGES